MGIEMEGLEFQIETKAEESVKGIDALTASLGSLKKALKGGLGLGSSVKQLERLTTAVNGLKSDITQRYPRRGWYPAEPAR